MPTKMSAKRAMELDFEHDLLAIQHETDKTDSDKESSPVDHLLEFIKQ